MRSVLTEHVNMRASDLGPGINERLQAIVAKRLEGRCSQHGYVRPGSVVLLKYSAGCLVMSSLNGDVGFRVSVQADVCLPPIGSVLRMRVRNMNRFGILCEVVDGDRVILKSLIVKGAGVCISEVELDTIKPDDSVLVEVMARKYELGDKDMTVVGRIVNSVKPRPPTTIVAGETFDGGDSGGEDDEDADADAEDGEEEEEEEEDDGEVDDDEEEEDGDDEEEDEDDDGGPGAPGVRRRTEHRALAVAGVDEEGNEVDEEEESDFGSEDSDDDF